MATQPKRSIKKFRVWWRFDAGIDEFYGFNLEDALKREGLPVSAIDKSQELPTTPEEREQLNYMEEQS